MKETFFDYETSLFLLVNISLLNLEVVEHVILQAGVVDPSLMQLLPNVIVVPSDVTPEKDGIAVVLIPSSLNAR